MVAARRARWNYALERAVELARDLGRPLVVLEALRLDYPWSSDRLHRFVIDGMADNAKAFRGTGVLYYPYVEPESGSGKGLLECLAKDSCAVVTDDYPSFFLPQMLKAAGEKLSVPLEAVDSNGILPMRSTEKAFTRAVDFRRFLQRELEPHLSAPPLRNPLSAKLKPCHQLPARITERWPRVSESLLSGASGELAKLAIDHSVPPAPLQGGSSAGRAQLKSFLAGPILEYGEGFNHPDAEISSGLSPYLHFGHISSHEVMHGVLDQEGWSPELLSGITNGRRAGWWGASAPVEAFLDQLITWRELGFCEWIHRSDAHRYESLPVWAKTTLAAHAADPRPHQYSLGQFEDAATHDDLWNAAQNQLRGEGRIHGYLRMLWGKKILHWVEDPREALEIMIQLNNKYAVDGRDPSSYSGIAWVLGRYDRAWGPERQVFGKVRFMSSANSRRKLRLRKYLEEWS